MSRNYDARKKRQRKKAYLRRLKARQKAKTPYSVSVRQPA